MIKTFRVDIYSYLLSIFLVYSTIANFSIYYLNVLLNSVIIVILFFVGFLIRPVVIKSPNKEVALFALGWGVVYSISILINGAVPSLNRISHLLICALLLYFNDSFQSLVFRRFVRILSLLFLLSAVEYTAYILTGKGFVVATVTRVTQAKEGDFYHLLFNIISVHDILYRFKALCAEPGNMGTLCAFMLFATWRIKTLRFPFFVFLVCGMMSLSLAFFIFLFIFLLTSVKPSVKNAFVGIVVFAAFIFAFKDLFENRIVDRLTAVDNIEELDNRTTDIFDYYFTKAYDEGDLWFGVGSDNLPRQIYFYGDGGNAGAKVWIFQYGIIGVVLIFCIYNAIYYRRSNKRLGYHDLVFLLVYWICFYKSVVFLTASIFIIFTVMPIINKKENV